METSLYDTIVPWYHLLDPREDHQDECAEYAGLLRAALHGQTLPGTTPTLLELGAGAGNNGSWLKKRFHCTLSDLSPQMLALSEAANPDCQHVVGDMRSLRLDRLFDVVLVHDAICHMLTRADLRAALATVAAHIRPGGVALVVPDCISESFVEWTDDAAAQDGDRALQYVARIWDPVAGDEQTQTDYAFLLRDPDGVRAVHVRHAEGLFSRRLWLDELAAVGLQSQSVPRTLPAEEAGGPYAPEMFLARRPA